MSDADRTKWDGRYAGPELRMGELANPVLRGWAHHLPSSGRALDLACGEGQSAIFLARAGLQVEGVDISGVGLAKARALADAEGPEVATRIRFVEADLDGGLPAECAGPYDVITAIHFRDPPLLTRIARDHLAPGGWLMTECLAAAPGAAFHPYRAAPGELRSIAALAGLRIVEEATRADHGPVARLLARKPADGSLRS